MTPEERSKKLERNPLHPYKVPEGYFQSFKEQLMSRIAEEELAALPPKKRKIDLFRPYLYAAAVIAAAVIAINSLTPTKDKTWEPQASALQAEEEISDEQFRQFLIDDTTEDYWGTVLLEDEEQENIVLSETR